MGTTVSFQNKQSSIVLVDHKVTASGVSSEGSKGYFIRWWMTFFFTLKEKYIAEYIVLYIWYILYCLNY